MILLGVDPGLSNGFALVEYKDKVFKPLRVETIKGIDKFLAELLVLTEGVDEIVVENFVIRPEYARSGAFDGDKMPAVQVLGACKLRAIQLKVPYVLQPPSAKPAGYGYFGGKYTKGKANVHHLDAMAHVVFRLVQHYKMTPPQTK